MQDRDFYHRIKHSSEQRNHLDKRLVFQFPRHKRASNRMVEDFWNLSDNKY